MKILDSNFLIAILKKEPSAAEKIDELMNSQEQLATTIFNVHEVLYGCLQTKDPTNYTKTKRFLESLVIIDYNSEGAHHAVELILTLKRKGRFIGLFDELIAGICLSQGATIVTRNNERFKRVSGLEVEKW